MRNTSGIPRKIRKINRAQRKANWKKELPDYYVQFHNTSRCGQVYFITQVNRIVGRMRVW